MSFMGTSGIHEFHFTLDSAQATHVAWEHADYPHTTDAFLLERAFHQVGGKRPQVVDLPLPRVADMTRYHNPTRPAHLKGGALVRRRRSYSPNEFRSAQAVGLEQSPAYFTKSTKTVHRAKSPHTGDTPEKEQTLERNLHPSIILEITELPLVEETPGLHLEIEADLSLHQNNQLLYGLAN